MEFIIATKAVGKMFKKIVKKNLNTLVPVPMQENQLSDSGDMEEYHTGDNGLAFVITNHLCQPLSEKDKLAWMGMWTRLTVGTPCSLGYSSGSEYMEKAHKIFNKQVEEKPREFEHLQLAVQRSRKSVRQALQLFEMTAQHDVVLWLNIACCLSTTSETKEAIKDAGGENLDAVLRRQAHSDEIVSTLQGTWALHDLARLLNLHMERNGILVSSTTPEKLLNLASAMFIRKCAGETPPIPLPPTAIISCACTLLL